MEEYGLMKFKHRIKVVVSTKQGLFEDRVNAELEKLEEEGNEIFTAKIRQIADDKTEIKYDYTKTFSNGAHLISFTPSKIGSYSIDISLNGKKYGENILVKINAINKSKYSCMNKKQVDNIIDCDEDYQDSSVKEENKYRYYVKSILSESLMCYNSN